MIFQIIYKFWEQCEIFTLPSSLQKVDIYLAKSMQSEIQQQFYEWDTEQTLFVSKFANSLKNNTEFYTCRRLYILNERKSLFDEIKETNQKLYTERKSHCFSKDQTVFADVTRIRKLSQRLQQT